MPRPRAVAVAAGRTCCLWFSVRPVCLSPFASCPRKSRLSPWAAGRLAAGDRGCQSAAFGRNQTIQAPAIRSPDRMMLCTPPHPFAERPMKTFLERFGGLIAGVLSGFDRLRLRGTRRLLAHVSGLKHFLWRRRVRLQDFDAYVQDTTATLCAAVQQAANDAGRPVVYVPSSNQDKGSLAREVMERAGLREGLVGVWSCVEPCSSYMIYRNKDTRKLELRRRERKCLHYY